MDQKIFQTPASGFVNQLTAPSPMSNNSHTFDNARISAPSIVILPVTSTTPVIQGPPRTIRFAPHGTLAHPPLVATAPPLIPLNQPQSSTVTHLMVGPSRRESTGPVQGGPVSIFMGTPRPHEYYNPISQRQQLIQSSMNNNYRAVMEPIHIKQEADYNLVRPSQEIHFDRSNDEIRPTLGQTSHNSIEDEEPEAEPPSNDLIPVNMTQQKISAMSKGPMALVKPEEQNNFPEIYNASTSTEDCSLISSQPFSVRNKSDVVSSRTILEFDGNDQVLCRVCGDKASGFHYGVHSCEGCKGFFRRSIQQKIQYRPCTKNQQCNILRINRNRCQYCRLKKCIAAGMSRDAVRFGRVPKREKAKILAAMQSSRQKTQESKILTEMNDDSKIIETIVRAHYDTCDYTRNKIEPFIQKSKTSPSYISCTGSTCPMKGRSDDSFHEQFSERFMDHVRQVCTFAKLIPGFKCLHHDDQVTLLKSCVFEVLLVRLAGLFDSQALICLNGDLIRKDTITHMPPGNAKFLMDSVFGLALRMNQFGLSDAEIGLFCAVVIITADRPGLRNPELVHKMQSKLKSVLSNILLPQHPEHATMFSELMTMVHDLRTLNTLHTEKFLQQFKFGGGSSSGDSAISHIHQDGGSSDEGSQGSNDSSPTNQIVGAKRNWVGNEQDSTGNESPQSYTDTTSTGSVEDGCMNRRSPGMGSVSSSESVRSTEILKLTTNDLKVTGSALLNALATPTSISSIAIAAAEVAAKNPSLAASTRSSSATLCPIMSRRREVDPLCSEFSASKHVDSQKIEQQFMINNLKLLPLQPMSETGSSSSTVAITNKCSTTTPPTMASSSSGAIKPSDVSGGSKYKTQTRKLDSPSDSGIDSPKGAQGSTNSTNTSVCSSPRNEEEKNSNGNLLANKVSDDEVKNEVIEPMSSHENNGISYSEDSSKIPSSSKSSPKPEEHHQHPLLKRALEQPPQSFNPMMGGVTTFQDEVYKPHKKFRRSNLPPSANIDECPSSTQTGSPEERLSSPPPSTSHNQTNSLLASQLTEAPKSYEPRLRSPPQAQPISLLASTLRRETPLSTPEEAKRNELLANLILEGNVPPLCPIDPEHQGLLMCAMGRDDVAYSHHSKSKNTNASNKHTTSSLSGDHCRTENNTTCPIRRQLPPPTATITSHSSKSESSLDYRSSPSAAGSYCPYSTEGSLEAGTRHIPVQQAPTKPQHHHSQSSVIPGVSSSSRSSTSGGSGLAAITTSNDTPPHPEELSKLHSLAEAAASLSAVETNGSSVVNSTNATGIMDSQPLNLSTTTRTSPSKQNVPTEA